MEDKLPCEYGMEHQIGQKYDERRGIGNGPQICLYCDQTLKSIINQARIDELEIIDKLDDPYEIPDEYIALKVIQKYTKDRIKELKELNNE